MSTNHIINPVTHDGHHLIDCAKTVQSAAYSRCAETNKRTVIQALNYPCCFRSLPLHQRGLIIIRAQALGMLNEHARLKSLDRQARMASAGLSLSAVVPRLQKALLAAMLLLILLAASVLVAVDLQAGDRL